MTIQLRYPFQAIQPVTGTFGDGHRGIDYGCVEGTPVLASFDGRVIFAGMDNTGFGNLVKIDCGEFYLLYGHLSNINAQIGAWVRCGQFIGFSGNTGNSTGPHMHFEMRMKGLDNGMYGAVDPQPYIVPLDGDEPAPAPVDDGYVEKIGFVRVNTDLVGLNIRRTYSIDNPAVGFIPNGIVVGYIGIRGDWLKLTKDAWIAAKYGEYQLVDFID